MYKICYDVINPITKRVQTVVMATARNFEKANELLRYYESEETSIEFYLVKEESK